MNNSTIPRIVRRGLLALLLASFLLLGVSACTDNRSSIADSVQKTSRAWFATWGIPIYTSFPNAAVELNGVGIIGISGLFNNNEAVNQSFRMMVHPSTGGDRIRLRFSNAYGSQTLVLRNISVAKRAAPTGPTITGTPAPVLFNGQSSVSIPAGGEVFSDGTDFHFASGDFLAVSFYTPGPTGPMSWHSSILTLQYASLPNSGDVTLDPSGLAFLNASGGWFFLSELDTLPADKSSTPTIVFLGDSITQGFPPSSTLDLRYVDLFARRLQAAGLTVGIVNAGIGGNTVTPVRDPAQFGASALERFAHDVLSINGLRSVFILEGTNDLSEHQTADAIYAGLVAMAQQAWARGVCVVVSTVLPRDDPQPIYGWDAATEEPERKKLNKLILSSAAFDAKVDLSSVMANPLAPDQPFQAYFVDGLHPNPLGYSTMANAIPFEPLLPPPLGRCTR